MLIETFRFRKWRVTAGRLDGKAYASWNWECSPPFSVANSGEAVGPTWERQKEYVGLPHLGGAAQHKFILVGVGKAGVESHFQGHGPRQICCANALKLPLRVGFQY